jgi:Rieske 2Fe-2S family protein
LFHRVNQQDFDACERCQPNMSSRLYAHGGVLVPNEHHIGAFHEWVTEKLGDTTAPEWGARTFGTRRRGRRSRSW